MKQILDWIDHRTGYRGVVKETLYENIPGGSRWRYVWGSTLVFVFFVQVVTGIFLWMAYSPSTGTVLSPQNGAAAIRSGSKSLETLS